MMFVVFAPAILSQLRKSQAQPEPKPHTITDAHHRDSDLGLRRLGFGGLGGVWVQGLGFRGLGVSFNQTLNLAPSGSIR